MDYEAAEEAAKRWGVSTRWVQALCRDNRIPGAKRLGRVWLLPRGVEKPPDQRIKLYRGRSNPRDTH